MDYSNPSELTRATVFESGQQREKRTFSLQDNDNPIKEVVIIIITSKIITLIFIIIITI
jgi:hypothetical protein